MTPDQARALLTIVVLDHCDIRDRYLTKPYLDLLASAHEIIGATPPTPPTERQAKARIARAYAVAVRTGLYGDARVPAAAAADVLRRASRRAGK